MFLANFISLKKKFQGVPQPLNNVAVQSKALQQVKRKLQFIPVGRYVIKSS